MPKRLFIKDGGLSASIPTPTGFTVIGSDNGTPKKQIESTISDIGGYTPPYKVYTALLTQSGGSNLISLNSGLLNIGVTYWINEALGVDFTNVGAPNNDPNTYFVATGTTPNSWGPNEGNPEFEVLLSNTGAPVATVLENTIGNIVWTRNAAGQYSATLSSAFTLNKTFVLLGRSGANTGAYFEQNWVSANAVDIFSVNYGGFNLDDTMYLVPIEIRVYN